MGVEQQCAALVSEFLKELVAAGEEKEATLLSLAKKEQRKNKYEMRMYHNPQAFLIQNGE